MELTAHAIEAVQVKFKSVGNEEHFALQVETVFRPHLPKDCSGVTE
jgi:hypothetical protein